jgi:FAD/FMN-containing dehydrogenase
MILWNWNDSAHCTPAELVAPKSEHELAAIVGDSELYPSPVRAIGELHSLNACFTTPGTAVQMKHFRATLDPVDWTVTVGAGVRMIDLRDWLKPHGLQIEVVPEIGNATAGSVACCGTKDSSLGPNGLGQISSTVVGVKMVSPDGGLVTVTEASDPERMRQIRSSYGLLGIIYEVTFRTRPLQKIRYHYEWLTLTPVPPLGSRVLAGADGFLGFLLPYHKRLLVERRTIVRDATRIGTIDRVKSWIRDTAWKSGARPINLLPRGISRWLGPRLVKWTTRGINTWLAVVDNVLKFLFVKLIRSFVAYRVDAMLDFRRDVASHFEFTFWAFPASSWPTVLPAYFEFCEEFFRRTGFRPALPTEVYFIRRDNHSPLSFSANEDIFTLDMVDWTPRETQDAAYWELMHREFNDFAARHGARPLLNQTKHITRSVVHRTLGREWLALREQCKAEDPRGRFLNPYFADLL